MAAKRYLTTRWKMMKEMLMSASGVLEMEKSERKKKYEYILTQAVVAHVSVVSTNNPDAQIPRFTLCKGVIFMERALPSMVNWIVCRSSTSLPDAAFV